MVFGLHYLKRSDQTERSRGGPYDGYEACFDPFISIQTKYTQII
jgi:hypothetical protein